MDIRRVCTSELPEDVFWGYAYMTATVVGTDRDDISDGWIDPTWSMFVLHDSRNDVRPAATWSRMEDIEDGETVRESWDRWIRETVDEHLGMAENSHDGTYYGIGETTAPDGDTWTYALTFVASHHAMRRSDIEFRVHTD